MERQGGPERAEVLRSCRAGLRLLVRGACVAADLVCEVVKVGPFALL